MKRITKQFETKKFTVLHVRSLHTRSCKTKNDVIAFKDRAIRTSANTINTAINSYLITSNNNKSDLLKLLNEYNESDRDN